MIEKVDSGNYKTNEEVVVEYMKALVFSEKLAEYAKQGGPTDERDHRSVKRLLKDLQVRILFADPAVLIQHNVTGPMRWTQIRIRSWRKHQDTSAHFDREWIASVSF